VFRDWKKTIKKAWGRQDRSHAVKWIANHESPNEGYDLLNLRLVILIGRSKLLLQILLFLVDAHLENQHHDD
jgi:hypothetical protein